MQLFTRFPSLPRLFVVLCLTVAIKSCVTGRNRDHGEVVGVLGRKGWKMEAPFEMVFIPGGSFLTGAVDQDVATQVNPPRQIAVSSLYVDKYPVTNNKYRQFINTLLEEAASEQEKYEEDEDTDEEEKEEVPSVIESTTDADEASLSTAVTEEFVMQKLYPDMSVWQSDFDHHMADRMVEEYFESPAFDDFPVVGVDWEAAKYYTQWCSEYLNAYREDCDLYPMPKFRLPTAAEWTYVAKGGKEFAKYPWGGPYVRNATGELLANFKSSRGNYGECGYECTSPVGHFAANDYGIYDLGGNVSEWTLDAYNPVAPAVAWDLNPVYLDEEESLKIIKGGSWKDIADRLRVDVVDHAHKNKRASYIGFRRVMPHIGEEPLDKQ